MTHVSKYLILLSIVLTSVAGCRKKSSDDDETSDLVGATTPVSVQGDNTNNGGGTVTVDSQGNKTLVSDNAVPGSFSITSSATSDEKRPIIKWASATAAVSYSVDVSTSADCSSPITSKTGITTVTWRVEADLWNGTYYVCVRAINANGTSSATNNKFVLTINGQILDLLDAYINNSNKASYSISGTCDSGPVTISADDGSNAAVSSSVSCVGGAFQGSLDLSSLDEGTVTIGANSPDVAQTIEKTKDTIAPASVGITAPADVVPGNVASYSIGGACSESGLAVSWSIDDGNFASANNSGDASCDGSNWSVSSLNLTPQEEGTLTYTASFCDAAGNCASPVSDTAVKDTTDPIVTITSAPTINSGNEGSYTLSGTCDEDTATVSWSISDGSNPVESGTTTCNDPSWTASSIDVSGLDDATLTVRVDMDDAYGNSATQAVATPIKNSAAVSLNLTTPVAITSANVSNYSISGTCGNGANGEQINWSIDDQNGGIAAVSGNLTCVDPVGTWSVTNINLTSLEEGVINFSVDIAAAANPPPVETESPSVIVKDVTAPAVPNSFVLNFPGSSPGKETTPILRWTGLTSGEIIRVYSDNTCDTELASGTSAGTTLNIPVTLGGGDGDYDFWATAEDAYGNQSACSTTTVAYTLDTQINAITGVAVAPSSTSPSNDPSPDIRVSGVASGDTVKLYSSGSCQPLNEIGFDVATGATVDITVSPNLSGDGVHNIYARSNDAAGNFSACTTLFAAYDLDTQPPSAPSTVVLNAGTTTPDSDPTPVIDVGGLTVGFDVTLYLDSGCTVATGTMTVATATEDVTSSALSTQGTYNYYATQTDLAGNESACSTANINYIFDNAPPSLSFVHIESAGGAAIVGENGEAFLTYTASEPLNTNTVQIYGKAATVINTAGTTYVASYRFTAADIVDQDPVTFSITYTDFVGNVGVDSPRTTTSDASSLEFVNDKASPSIVIANQVGAEASNFNYNVNDSFTSNDTDLDGDDITYTCFYDTVVDSTVGTGTACTSLTGFTVNASTGELDWTPGYSDAGVYELRVIGTDDSAGSYKGEEIFTLTINNTNRAPVLASVADQEMILAENFNFNMQDTNTGNDTDIDGDTITYSCVYDNTVDGAVAAGTNCSTLAGLNFNTSTGFFTWTITPTTPGDFEFKVVGSDGSLSDDEIFEIYVTIDISKVPQLAMVGDGTSGTTTYVASLGDANEVSYNGGAPVIYQAGDTFTIPLTTKGDKLECTGGCFALTPINGTAAWSTETYSGTLLSTYMGRYSKARVVVAAFAQDAIIDIDQDGVNRVSQQQVLANQVREFPIDHTVGALWITSDQPVSAYISTDTSYDKDGRVITASSTENIGFVSGGGGTPAAITTTTDGTYVESFRNDGTNVAGTININQILTVTDTVTRQNAAVTAIAFYSDAPTVSTQHADGDGTNSTPSLPRSMLATHFVTPMPGDYVSLAAFDPSPAPATTVTIIDENGDWVSEVTMTKGSSDVEAPYAYSYNPGPAIPTGYRFICSTPCIGIFEPQKGGAIDDDETLMVGTLKDPFTVVSSDFEDGDTLPSGSVFKGNDAAGCAGENDFPNIDWSEVPWGTTSLSIIVEDETSGRVHLNLVDVDPTIGSIGKLESVGNEVTFPSGIQNTGSYTNPGWEGPCQTTGEHTYRIKVYAMKADFGSAISNATSISAFEAANSANILKSTSISFKFDDGI
jgi:phosphatidylethanolamine-binding protein (PEBP) family uncharacterized protein